MSEDQWLGGLDAEEMRAGLDWTESAAGNSPQELQEWKLGCDSNSVGLEYLKVVAVGKDYGFVGNFDSDIPKAVDTYYYGTASIDACSSVDHIRWVMKPVAFEPHKQDNVTELMKGVGKMMKLQQILMGRWQNAVQD